VEAICCSNYFCFGCDGCVLRADNSTHRISDARPDFQPYTREVADLIEAPLSQLLDPARRGLDTRVRDGILIEYPHFDVAGHQVWGATGMVLSEFVALFGSAYTP